MSCQTETTESLILFLDRDIGVKLRNYKESLTLVPVAEVVTRRLFRTLVVDTEVELAAVFTLEALRTVTPVINIHVLLLSSQLRRIEKSEIQ